MRVDDLTGRHLEVAQLVLDGFTTPNIAQRLGISKAAASRLLREVFAKVGVRNRSELRTVWIRDHWTASLERISRYVDRHGHSRVPRDYADEDGALGALVVNIRHHHAGLAGVSPGPFPGIDYAQELDSIEGWEW